MTTLELADIQVDDLESLRRALEADTHGDGEVRWTTVTLANLFIRDNSADINPQNTWVCCLLYTSPSPRDFEASRMPSSA